MIDTSEIDRWLELYVTAWKTDAPDDVARPFADHARYYTEPFREAHVGRDDIVAWWIGQGDSKIPWTFEYEVIAREDNLHVVRGVTRYPEGVSSERSAPEAYHNIWLVTLEADGRAIEFVEYWMLAH